MSDFGPRTQETLPRLSIEEKAAITAGSGFFSMTGVERLGIPNWSTTDGPNGARGSSFLGSGDSKATCIPCGSALGATWDPELVEELGVMLGAETRMKACRVLLAPTVNLHRSPLAGRNFECFSEDPLLSGRLAAAYVRGVQSQGVITTVKHFVGNECETDRWTSDSLIDERALRELYLVPFEIAVREGDTLGIMTSYNRMNGRYCTEQRWLLTDVLRDEWGFEGFVTTDWMAGADTVLSADAGLTIEMPAGDRAMGAALAAAVRDGRVSESTLDELAGRVLSVFESIGAWDDEPGTEQSIDRLEHRALARRAAAAAMVLLRNEAVDGDALLPLVDVSTIAVIGPNAGRAQIMGGGSANLRPFHRTSPLDALLARLGGSVEISHAEGCNIDKEPPLLSGPSLVSPTGEQGFLVEVFDNLDFAGDPVGTASRDTSRLLFGDEALPGVTLSQFSMRATTSYTPATSGVHSFELTQVSPSRLLLDGEIVADGITERPPLGRAFFGFGATVAPVDVTLEAGRAYEIAVELEVADVVMFGGADLRVRSPFPSDALEQAVAAAAAADVAIVVVGTNDDWETEGEDRTFLGLPGEQDALVNAVAAANPRTVVVVNTGSPVAMPWAEEVPAIVQSWLGGQEMADALVDVLTGEVDPGGRLPTTFPLRVEHNPSFGNFPGDNGQVPYAEGIFVGYRWYDSRHLPVLFPFGHGLSYAQFDVGDPVLSADVVAAGESVTVSVPVTNTGARQGSHVVQCYVRPHRSRIVRPDRELKAFRKVTLDPGASTTVELILDERSFAYWDPAQPEWPELRDRQAATLPQLQGQERRTDAGWTVEPGKYDLVIANSVADIVATSTVEVTADD
jgi:beta-glucosidase